MWLLSLLQLSLFCFSVSGEGSSHELTFMFITSFGQFGFNSSGAIPGVTMALRDINNRSDLLPGYTLQYDRVRDSQCHRTHSLDSFFEGIQSDPVKIAVVGSGCSVATVPVAEISHRWNITQLSYASATTTLSDRTRFKRYFRTSTTIEIVAPGLHSAVKHFKWTRIALLTQTESLFTGAEAAIRNEFESGSFTVRSTVFQTSDEDPVASSTDFFLESEDYRVFILNCYSLVARKIACEALKRGLTYPRYAWIAFDWYPSRWWTEEISKNIVNCTDSELAEFVEKTISLRRYPARDDSENITDTGITAVEFEEEYQRRAKEGGYEVIDAGVRLYDVLWILAYALNSTMTMINAGDISGTGCENVTGELVPLEHFNYTNEKVSCVVQYHIQKSNFDGSSGYIAFDERGSRIHDRVTLKQYRFDDNNNLMRKRFAYTDRTENFTFTFESMIDDSYVYPDGVPPDGSPIETIHTYKTGLVVFIYILASFGIIFSSVCLVFNFVFRKRRVVRISSPSLNYFIITGAIMMYMAMYVHLIPTTKEEVFEAHCLLKDWLFTIGYALCYGTVLSKMYRIYYIFNNPTAKKTTLHDRHLIVFILAVTGFGVLLVLLESSIPELRGEVELEVDNEHPSGETDLGVQIQYSVWVCYGTSTAASYWKILTFAYLAVLQVVGIVLAFQTRNVKIKALRDSKLIASVIYISSLVLVFLGVSTFALRTYINARGAVFANGIFVLTTIFLALLFIPKMILLYKDPDGKAVFEESNPVTHAMDTSDMKIKLTQHEKELRVKDEAITELNAELEQLKKVLNPGASHEEDTAQDSSSKSSEEEK